MKQIFDIDEIKGKTIEKTFELDYDNLVLKFADSFIILEAQDERVIADLTPISSPPNVHNCKIWAQLGVITISEMQQIQIRASEESEDLVRKNEIAKLKELKEKYPNV